MSSSYAPSRKAHLRQNKDPSLERFRTLVKKMGGITTFATMTGTPVSSVSAYMYGRELKLSAAVKIAIACSVSLEWLAGISEHPEGAFPTTSPDQLPATDTLGGKLWRSAPVRLYEAETRLKRDTDGLTSTETEQIGISQNLLSMYGLIAETTIVVRVTSDSMEPTFKRGDCVLVDISTNDTLHGPAAIIIDGVLTLKRLTSLPGRKVALISDNPLYPPLESLRDAFKRGHQSTDNGTTILGRVAARLHET